VRYARDAASLRLAIDRRAGQDVERVAFAGGGLAPRAGDVASYEGAGGLRVSVRVEGIEEGAPPAESFVDPDAPGGER
jgi:hypothetical protein